LNIIGYSHALLGNYPEALTYCQQALAACHDMEEDSWEEAVWDSLGYIHHKLGHYQQAITCYQRSIGLLRGLADRYNEASTLAHLGDAHHSAGNTAAAHQAWAQALRIFDQIDHPDGDHVRAKLRFPATRRITVLLTNRWITAQRPGVRAGSRRAGDCRAGVIRPVS